MSRWSKARSNFAQTTCLFWGLLLFCQQLPQNHPMPPSAFLPRLFGSKKVSFWRWQGIKWTLSSKYPSPNSTHFKKHFKRPGDLTHKAPSPSPALSVYPQSPQSHRIHPHPQSQGHAQRLFTTPMKSRSCGSKEEGSLKLFKLWQNLGDFTCAWHAGSFRITNRKIPYLYLSIFEKIFKSSQGLMLSLNTYSAEKKSLFLSPGSKLAEQLLLQSFPDTEEPSILECLTR